MPTPITCNEDLRQLAMRRVPRAIFDYVDRGSYDELTIRANRTALDRICLRQRVMVDVSGRSTASTMLGENVTMPVAIAPTGLTGIMHPDGEMLAAQAAADFGVPFALSTMSILSIEQVRAAVTEPFWFQLYVMRDRGFVAEMIQRAVAADCSALILTADLQVQGQRHRDVKNGLTVPPKLTLANLLDVCTKPRWALGMLRAQGRSFGNLAGHAPTGRGLSTLSQWIAGQFDPSLSWKDVAWVRSLWPGKLIVKGILDPEDARLAVAAGADAIVVSNHGGRQLDGAPGAIEALPRIAETVGADAELWFDSGVRSGQDVLKALALGARGVMIGKAFLYGLGAMGKPGVTRALELIHAELDVSMALTGTSDVRSVDRRVLWMPDARP
ncbi:MAG: alpha-hydroxy-acid oxidizing protein [Pseudomonadales bacterium]|nr:alpha-hydroxy-acid oxidizing protein [Pseudomonadales bacterium]MBP9032820.1 alpha-hydroxy-acid oxidizing protein [Pseudomonadales bacterium]